MANVDIFLPGAGSPGIMAAYRGSMNAMASLRRVINFNNLVVPAADVVRYAQLVPGTLLFGAVIEVGVGDTGADARTFSAGYDGAATAFVNAGDAKTPAILGTQLAAPVLITTLTNLSITTIEEITNAIFVATVFYGKVDLYDPSEVL